MGLFLRLMTLFMILTRPALASDSTLGSQAAVGPSSKFIGVFDYKGGFASALELRLQNPMAVRFIQIQIPKFCTAEVVSLSASINGISTNIDSAWGSNDTFIVSRSPAPVSSLVASFNGPMNVRCAIAAYAIEQPLLVAGRYRTSATCRGLVFGDVDLYISQNAALVARNLANGVQNTFVLSGYTYHLSDEPGDTLTPFSETSFIVGFSLASECRPMFFKL